MTLQSRVPAQSRVAAVTDRPRTRSLEVVRARAMGTCFGVRDALERAFAEQDPGTVTIWGELVHNPAVLARLRDAGFDSRAERARGGRPSRPRVLITAHGVSNRERARLEAQTEGLIDTTCPLVKKAHDVALELAAEGRHVVVIGRRGHVEVEGLLGDVPHGDAVASPSEVAHYPYPRLGVLCQTTTPPDEVAAVLREIRALNPSADVRFVDTVCAPTRDRQEALQELAGEVELAVVVGGRNSNNTAALAATLEKLGCRTVRVEGPDDLRVGDFVGVTRVGLTAGTSTLDATIDAVEARLRSMGA